MARGGCAKTCCKGSDDMLTWIIANLINIALVALILLVVALVICGRVRAKKAGKSACGCAAIYAGESLLFYGLYQKNTDPRAFVHSSL